jgi:hypothetical protein
MGQSYSYIDEYVNSIVIVTLLASPAMAASNSVPFQLTTGIGATASFALAESYLNPAVVQAPFLNHLI